MTAPRPLARPTGRHPTATGHPCSRSNCRPPLSPPQLFDATTAARGTQRAMKAYLPVPEMNCKRNRRLAYGYRIFTNYRLRLLGHSPNHLSTQSPSPSSQHCADSSSIPYSRVTRPQERRPPNPPFTRAFLADGNDHTHAGIFDESTRRLS